MKTTLALHTAKKRRYSSIAVRFPNLTHQKSVKQRCAAQFSTHARIHVRLCALVGGLVAAGGYFGTHQQRPACILSV